MAAGQEIHVNHEHLRALCTAIQVGFGVRPQDAEVVTDCLVEANLAGLDTHGVIRLKLYMDRIRAGGISLDYEIRTVRENPCTALLDAGNCLGPVGGKLAMDRAMAKASSTGIGALVIRNCNHYGPAGHYARMATSRDLIGISATNTLASMPPTGGAAARQGNNAYAIGFPAGEEPAVIVDGATSMSSWGKLFLCAQSGQDLPLGYADSQGRPTVSAPEVMAGGFLLPFAGHKGYGLAVALELLTGMLGEAQLDHEIPHPYKQLADPGANTFFMAALRVDCFCDLPGFKQRMDEWIRLMRATPLASGADRIWLPGEKEAAARRERLASGVHLNPNMVDELRTLAEEAGVACDLG